MRCENPECPQAGFCHGKCAEEYFSHVPADVDKTKKYACYFCEETIVFRDLTKEEREVLVNKGAGLKPSWMHEDSGIAACQTFATPSNIEVV